MKRGRDGVSEGGVEGGSGEVSDSGVGGREKGRK